MGATTQSPHRCTRNSFTWAASRVRQDSATMTSIRSRRHSLAVPTPSVLSVAACSLVKRSLQSDADNAQVIAPLSPSCEEQSRWRPRFLMTRSPSTGACTTQRRFLARQPLEPLKGCFSPLSNDSIAASPALAVIRPSDPVQDCAIEGMAADVSRGLQGQVDPIAVDDGIGGVYFMRNKWRRIAAVFKPVDEEPFAVNNPKSHRPNQGSDSENNYINDGDDNNNGSLSNNDNSIDCRNPATCSSQVGTSQSGGIRRGIPVGGAATREVAAYLLDHGHQAGVPATTLASATHRAFYCQPGMPRGVTAKMGSLQVYVPHECTADDVAERFFSVEQVHAMALLDIRLVNQDRHGGNILAVRQHSSPSKGEQRTYDLVPIDHGACLPRVTSMGETRFAWLAWPQTKAPFSASTLEYIKALDGIRDAEFLVSQLPSQSPLEPEALLTLVLSTTLLQHCAINLGMSAHGIGQLMCRGEEDERDGFQNKEYDCGPIGDDPQDAQAQRNNASTMERIVWATVAGWEPIPTPDQPAWHPYLVNMKSRFRDLLQHHIASTNTNTMGAS